MKRKTNTLDAEYKRRGLMRPNQAFTAGTKGVRKMIRADEVNTYHAEFFDWKGTTVWGVNA